MTDKRRNLELYRGLVARFFDDSVRGKANPYTAMNGNMYSFLDSDGRLCLRLSEKDRAAYADGFGTGPVVQYGAVMKGYVAVPDDALADPDSIAELFSICLSFAKSLKPK